MEYKDYNRALAQRFVNDYRLPIPIINEEIFFHHLLTYEESLNSWTLWCDAIDEINLLYDGDANKFLDDFYLVRDKIINTIHESEAYQKFNNMDMGQFSVDFSKYKPESKGYYNEQNIGRKLLSIDLRKANFQALNYVDKEILLNSDTYEDFVGKFTDSLYIRNSKYFRQVVFGQMNPGRHTTIEKYLISKVLETIKHIEDMYNLYETEKMYAKVVCINADEVVIEDNGLIIPIMLEQEMKDNYGIIVHTEEFELEGYNFYSNKDNHHRFTFYVKNGELMCVPGPYYAIAYKLYNDEIPHQLDYHFNYENVDCIFNDTFRIEKI